MKHSRILMTIGLAALLAPALASAADTSQPATTPQAATAPQVAATPIKAVPSMPDGTEVTITGTVENFDSRHPFTLRDASGTIDVDLSDVRPIALHDGEKVTITGDVSKGALGGLLGTDVAATDVRL